MVQEHVKDGIELCCWCFIFQINTQYEKQHSRELQIVLNTWDSLRRIQNMAQLHIDIPTPPEQSRGGWESNLWACECLAIELIWRVAHGIARCKKGVNVRISSFHVYRDKTTIARMQSCNPVHGSTATNPPSHCDRVSSLKTCYVPLELNQNYSMEPGPNDLLGRAVGQ